MTNLVRFWAGGGKSGWWVKFTTHPDYYPNTGPQHFTIRLFHRRDFANGELGAAKAANALCKRLNAALDNEDQQ